jgi:hypothetical protein
MDNPMAKQVAELAEIIQHHSNNYYNKAKQEITDAEYDALVEELKTLVWELVQKDPMAPEVTQGTEVLNSVGAVPSYGRKVTHSSLMGSLDKAYTVAEVVAWYKKYAPNGGKIVVMPKVDGCFRHDSKVLMANGEERPISEIKEGMKVLSFNERTGNTELKSVVAVLVRKSDCIPAKPTGWILLKFTEGKDIVCTIEHPFLTANRGWVEAKDLNEDDIFVEPEFRS